ASSSIRPPTSSQSCWCSASCAARTTRRSTMNSSSSPTKRSKADDQPRRSDAMPSLHGRFCWYELMTTDNKAAEAFYGKVVGWRPQDMDGPHGTYTILSAGEAPMGGLMTIPAEACAAGAKPGWSGYVAVDDVDDYAARVKQAGGAVLRG